MEAASNNGIFPLLTANRVISHLPGSMVVLVPTPVMVFSPSNFNDHVQAQSETMCGCRTARTAKPQTVITRPLLPNLLFEPPLALLLLFGSPAFLNSMRVFKWSFVHICMFADGFLNYFPIILSYSMWKTFNVNPEVSESCAGIKKMSAQCCVQLRKRRVQDPV